MDGVLDELQQGLQRLFDNRERARQQAQDLLDKQDATTADHLTKSERTALKGKSPFGQTLEVLKRLHASYRRCYHKSGSEMLFPILFGHMTFASHKCWKVYIKKPVYLAAEAWRSIWGKAVRHQSLKDGGGEILLYKREGLDDFPLPLWRRLPVETGL